MSIKARAGEEASVHVWAWGKGGPPILVTRWHSISSGCVASLGCCCCQKNSTFPSLICAVSAALELKPRELFFLWGGSLLSGISSELGSDVAVQTSALLQAGGQEAQAENGAVSASAWAPT